MLRFLLYLYMRFPMSSCYDVMFPFVKRWASSGPQINTRIKQSYIVCRLNRKERNSFLLELKISRITNHSSSQITWKLRLFLCNWHSERIRVFLYHLRFVNLNYLYCYYYLFYTGHHFIVCPRTQSKQHSGLPQSSTTYECRPDTSQEDAHCHC